MEIKEKIDSDLKEAMKKRDSVTMSTLRMLKAAVHNKEIDKKGEKLQDADVIKIIAKQLQQHQDSIEQFKKGKRDDLVEKETKELEVLKGYLPEQLSPDEITNIVKRVISEVGAKEKSEFGKVMKLVMPELKGQADGKLVSQIVCAQLNPPDKEER